MSDDVFALLFWSVIYAVAATVIFTVVPPVLMFAFVALMELRP